MIGKLSTIFTKISQFERRFPSYNLGVLYLRTLDTTIMSKELYEQFLEMYQTVPFPRSPSVTPEARKIYEHGLDVADTYRGHPDTLVNALKIFVQSGSRPYAYAGAAYILSSAAYQSGKTYDKHGMTAALKWLRKAQELAIDQPEINYLEAICYLKLQRLNDARTVLDHLKAKGYRDIPYIKAELYYCDLKKELKQGIAWAQQGMQAAKNEM
jgi:tetratricopeptide (TPR) repeat protein